MCVSECVCGQHGFVHGVSVVGRPRNNHNTYTKSPLVTAGGRTWALFDVTVVRETKHLAPRVPPHAGHAIDSVWLVM
jgi:hypothetical protein